MKIYTIGFTGKTAEQFFGLLNSADAAYLLDTRLNKSSQLAGFTKKGNIEYFIKNLTSMTYEDMEALTPEKEMFREYRSEGDWDLYESRYLELLQRRTVAESADSRVFAKGVVLLCSERTPEKCHRRLAAEYIKANSFPCAEIVHL